MSQSDSSTAVVEVTRVGSLAIICMNDPNRLNVLSTHLLENLNAALFAVAHDASVRAVVLKGAGRSFSAGGDLSEYRADFETGPAVAETMVGNFHACIRSIRNMPKPVIGALHGAIAGGGFSLAIACDICIATESATFLSAYTRIGTTPDGGGTWTLTQLLGVRRALDLILMNGTIDAQKALELGLVNKVVPADSLESAVLELAQRLADGPASAFATAKRLVYFATTSTIDEQLDREKAAFVAASKTRDFKEGITSFFEKRPGNFDR
jgi:2-(1,2-epoxy-1,2-dihydrophenyl)acetyl-CoA isomerase